MCYVKKKMNTNGMGVFKQIPRDSSGSAHRHMKKGVRQNKKRVWSAERKTLAECDSCTVLQEEIAGCHEGR